MAREIHKRILDQTIRSQVDLERYTEHVRRRVIRLLNQTQDSIIAEVVKQDPTRVVRTKWQRARLARLNKSVSEILNQDYGKIKRYTDSQLKGLSVLTGEQTVGGLNKLVGANIFDVTLTQEGLRAIVDNAMIDGKVIGKWWDKQKGDFKDKFASQMADAAQQVRLGLVRGEGVNEMVRRIRGSATRPGFMKNIKRETTALVRTSVQQVAQEARMEMYQGNADLIEGIEAVATLDSRTTPMCRSYDSKQWTMDYKPIGHDLVYPNFPAHWNCRTSPIPILKSFADLAGPKSRISKTKIRQLEKLSQGQRAAMTYDEKMLAIGKPVSGKTTYNEWLKTQSKAVQVDVLGPNRYKLWKEHRLSMSDMVHQNGRELTLDELRKKVGVVEEVRWKPVMSKKEANLWIMDSIEKRDFYHGTISGTAEKIRKTGFRDSFIGSHTGNAGFLGKGHYFSVHEGYAKQYGELIKTKINIKNPKIFEGSKDYVKWLETNKLPNIMLTMEDQMKIPIRITNILKKQGYDSVMMANGTELVVFDTKNVVIIK